MKYQESKNSFKHYQKKNYKFFRSKIVFTMVGKAIKGIFENFEFKKILKLRNLSFKKK